MESPVATRARKPKTTPATVLAAEQAVLEARIVELEQEMGRVVTDQDGRPAADADAGDAGSIDVERDRVTGLLAAAHERLAEVEGAMRRAEAGTWGVCIHCGRQISPERLEVLPSAEACIECASPRIRRFTR